MYARIPLFLRASTAKRQQMRAFEPPALISFFPNESRGETTRLFVDEGVVHQIKGLERRCAGDASGRAGVGVGTIEQGQVRMPLDALRHQVDAAPVCLVDGLERLVLCKVPGGLVG